MGLAVLPSAQLHPVCTTELGYLAMIKAEFDRRDVKIIGLSVDPIENHERWASDIADTQGAAPNYPLIQGVGKVS
jgi:alkyl hydroperoxide reductase subunit AhpC